MIPFKKKMHPLSGLMLGLALAAPAVEAKVEGATLTFSPGQGLTPLVKSERGAIKAGQRFVTGATEIRELLFPDGTSLTLGPSSEVVIETFDEAGAGPLVLRLEKGLIRIAGGMLNDKTPIFIKTPTAEITLDAASAVIEVGEDGRTRASLLFGRELKMASGGQTQSLLRPGFELVSTANETPLDGPARQTEGTAARDAFALNTVQLAGLAGQTPIEQEGAARAALGDVTETGITLVALATEDQPAGELSSSQPGNTPAPPALPTGGGGFVEVGSTRGGGGSGGFGPGDLLGGPNVTGEPASESAVSPRSATQNRDANNRVAGIIIEPATDEHPEQRGQQDASRDPDPTTNRIFNSEEPFTRAIDLTDLTKDRFPIAASDQSGSTGLQYLFFTVDRLVLDKVGDEKSIAWIGDDPPCCSGGVEAPFILPLPDIFHADASGTVAPPVSAPVRPGMDQLPEQSSIFGPAEYRILQAGFLKITADDLPDGDEAQAQTKRNVTEGPSSELVSREADNFLLVEARPAKATEIRRDQLRDVEFSNFNLADDGDDLLDALFLPRSNELVQQLADAILSGTKLKPLKRSEINFLDDADAKQVLAVVNQATQVAADESTERFLFATGDVDGRLAPNFKKTFAVDRFFISAGLDKFDEKDSRTVASNIRAFLRRETGLDLTLVDTGVFVVNSASDVQNTQTAFLHADFGMAGERGDQESTISVTIGNVEYRPKRCEDCDIKDSFEAVVSGRTIGSSHGDIVNTDVDGNKTTVKNATAAFSSLLTSTSAGGGNPALKRPGYAGYFVLENFAPEVNKDFAGGKEHGLGSASTSDTNYAVLRLATATGSETPVRSNSTLTGWAGGLAEKENNPGNALTIVPIGTGTEPGNFTIQTDDAANRVQANISLTGHTPMTLGGLANPSPNNPSAFIDDDRFAAGNEKVAMVNAELLRDSSGKLPTALQSIENYKHLQWGFFLGDTAGTAGKDLEHVHMGTWVAGRAADPGQLPSTGSATYAGHSIGNVFTGGSLYTAVGSYQNTWNFGQRSGAVNMNFDGAQYNGTTQLRQGTVVFEGAINAANASRAGGVVGSFVQGANDPAAGQAGRFAIGETPGNAAYRASGTFAAERKP